MASRTLSFILIAAILACPMACGTGIVLCCAVEASAPHSCPVHAGECQCESELAHAGQCGHDQPCPCPHHNFPSDDPCEHGKPCQGICGGAVLEKPFVPLFDLAFLPLVDLRWLQDQNHSEHLCLSLHADHFSGRTLRTLHMSFLC